jgi:acylphosphatase
MAAQNQGDSMKRITVVVSGRVQNVGYRPKVFTIANEFGLTGSVQNLEDGRVRIIAEGEGDNLDRFLDAIRIKNTLIDVGSVEVEYADATGDYANFYKLVGGGETEERLDKAAEYLLELIRIMKAGFGNLDYATAESIKQISTLRQETMKFGEDIGTMRRELVVEVGEQISTVRQETMKFGEDLGNMRRELVGEVGEQISTLRKERLLVFEKYMLSDMYEEFKQYDSALQKTLERFPYEKSVFIMMPFEKKDIRLEKITDTIKKTLGEYGMHGWRADDPGRTLRGGIWGNIVVNMLSCKYGIAVFVDKKVLSRYNDEEIIVFNANIALEVGFMKSRGLNVLLLKDKQLENIPTDIISEIYKEFNFDYPEGDIKKAVTEWIKDCQLSEMHNSRRSDHVR